MSRDNEKRSLEFGQKLRGVFEVMASSDDAEEVTRLCNIYPRLKHSVNKKFLRVGSKSYRVARLAQLGTLYRASLSPRRTLDDKLKGYKFAEALGLAIPQYQAGLSLNELDFQAPAVIKPMHSDGGKCIYSFSMDQDGRYFECFRKKQLSDKKSVLDLISREKDWHNIDDDCWIQEELIVGKDGTPSTTHDVKFYAFYGDVKLVLQVDRWKDKQFAFFNEAGDAVNDGRHKPAKGVSPVYSPDLLAKAKWVSKQIPWPHVRIDFLVSDNDVRLGEFTSNPGNFANFNDEWDLKLGEAYHNAASRLYEDLLFGDGFEIYKGMFREA